MTSLTHTDTVKCVLTGIGEENYDTKELYMAIREEIYRARGKKVKKINKAHGVWVGTCPKCGKSVVKTDTVENCGNVNCKEMLYWD